jgi:hypothetical protein
MNGALLSSCYIVSLLCCVFLDEWNEERGPPFIGGEEGMSMEYARSPHGKLQTDVLRI